jgi:hypothetical protein
MENSSSPSIRAFLPASIILMVIGWGGLCALLYYTVPSVWPRWLFFFSSVLALTGTSLPVVAYLNRRFRSTPPATPSVVLRQAIWCGIYFPTLAWLRIPRVLTLPLAILLAVALVLVEWLLRVRERSQWNPQGEGGE